MTCARTFGRSSMTLYAGCFLSPPGLPLVSMRNPMPFLWDGKPCGTEKIVGGYLNSMDQFSSPTTALLERAFSKEIKCAAMLR